MLQISHPHQSTKWARNVEALTLNNGNMRILSVFYMLVCCENKELFTEVKTDIQLQVVRV